jgi:Predicted membrane protein (DUF2339)
METQKQVLSIDLVIEKFIPVIGALFFVVGLGYLLYTSVWAALDTSVRLGLGFFLSVVMIGAGYGATDKLKYLADVIIGGGVVLLYGTLMYGSQATDIGGAVIPEISSLIIAVFFTLAVTYFAAERKSTVIFALGMSAAYLTPFVIGGEFGSSQLSFNSYLIYFASVNIIGTLIGRDFSVRILQPLNTIGLLFGTASLYLFAYRTIDVVGGSFWNSPTLSVILFVILVLGTVYSILSSSRHYSESEDGLVSIGYMLPIIWFILNILSFSQVNSLVIAGAYAVIAIGYYAGWWYLRDQNKQFQHIGLYAGAIIALIFAVFAFFPQYDAYVGLLVAWLGILFAYLYTLDDKRSERLVAYMIFSAMGAGIALLAVDNFTGVTQSYWTTLSLLALTPAALWYLVQMGAKGGKKTQTIRDVMTAYSVLFGSIMAMILLVKVLFKLPVTLIFFTAPALVLSLYALSQKGSPTRGKTLYTAMILLFIGFFGDFIFFIERIVPHAADMDLFVRNGIFTWNAHLAEAVLALIAMFVGLRVSREIQVENQEYRPSFILVIFAYSTLVLVVNYLIIVAFNQAGVSTASVGGPRAVATTFWWIVVACTMLAVGVQKGFLYRSEKLLGLLLLAITVIKIVAYDLSTLPTDKKIMVLMVVGWLLLALSYFFQTKNLFARDPKEAN